MRLSPLRTLLSEHICSCRHSRRSLEDRGLLLGWHHLRANSRRNSTFASQPASFAQSETLRRRFQPTPESVQLAQAQKQQALRRMKWYSVGIFFCATGIVATIFSYNPQLPNKNQREPTKPSTTTSLDAPPSILGTAPDLSPSPEVELVPTGTPAIPTFPKIIHISSLSPPQRAAVGNSSEEEYQLVGLGIRTVSFLGIQVYVVGLYIAVSDIATLQERLIRTLDPVATALVAGEKGKLKDLLLDPQRGEDVWNSILQDGGLRTAFRIVPVRNTDYMHLRDGWVRSLTARTQHFASSKKDTSFDDESFGNALNEFKAMWGGGARKSVPKGEVLLLTRDAAGKMTAWHEDKVGNGLRLGGIEDERISRLIWLGYLGGKNVSSEGARQSVVDGVIEFVERPIGTVATQVI